MKVCLFFIIFGDFKKTCYICFLYTTKKFDISGFFNNNGTYKVDTSPETLKVRIPSVKTYNESEAIKGLMS